MNTPNDSFTSKEVYSNDMESVYKQVELDKKIAPMVINMPTCLLATLVGVPVFLSFVVPLSIVYQIIKSILPHKAQIADDSKQKPETFSGTKPLENRKYDIVLLGCTGLTGRLATLYLAKTYGVNKKVKWALAGRSRERIEKVMKEMNVDDVDVIVVDTMERSTLHELVKDTRVVMSTVGPYAKYGSNVVEFCAEYGTSYVDITGETDWSRDMLWKWNDTAKRTGAMIVSLCGMDSIPSDMSVFKLFQLLKHHDNNEDLVHVSLYNQGKLAGISGGTIDTLITHAIDRSYSPERRSFDPYLLRPDGTKSSARLKNKSSKFITKVPGSPKQWTAPWFMTQLNADVAKRSHALRCRDGNLVFDEAWVHPDWKTAWVTWLGLVFFLGGLLNPFTKTLMERFVLPNLEPTDEEMERGYLLLKAYGRGSNGTQVQSALYFHHDTGYLDSARMLTESALCLALERDKLPHKDGGFYSPSVGLGDILLNRLCQTGCKFAYRISPQK